jgi:hypothetical protein
MYMVFSWYDNDKKIGQTGSRMWSENGIVMLIFGI